MSFGEHLEELRSALIKAIAALAIGVLIGFLFANRVVAYIQTPLKQGLAEFRLTQASKKFNAYLAEREAAGDPIPKEQQEAARQLIEDKLLPRIWRVDPNDLATVLEANGIDAAELRAAEGLLPLTVYTPSIDDPRNQTIGTHVLDGFSVFVKAALLVGVIISSPATFYFLWSFIASGLYPHERNKVYLFLPFSLGLFLFGAAVAFFIALGYVLDTLFWFYLQLEIDPLPQIGQWLNFALLLPIGFGIGFQLPLVMLFLERIGIFKVEDYVENWRYGVLAIAIASMLLTPSDWQSMVLLGVPMVGLYFGGIALCRLWPRQQTPLDVS